MKAGGHPHAEHNDPQHHTENGHPVGLPQHPGKSVGGKEPDAQEHHGDNAEILADQSAYFLQIHFPHPFCFRKQKSSVPVKGTEHAPRYHPYSPGSSGLGALCNVPTYAFPLTGISRPDLILLQSVSSGRIFLSARPPVHTIHRLSGGTHPESTLSHHQIYLWSCFALP